MADRRDALPFAIAFGVTALLVALLIATPRSASLSPRKLGAYEVAYRITDRSDDPPTVRTETVTVRRPFDARVVVRSREAVLSGRVSNREFQWDLASRGRERFGFRRSPGGPLRDVSVTALADAAREGVVDRLGIGDVIGRRCAWFAFEEPFPAELAPPTSQSRTEACVDATGIMLAEVWTIDGRVVRMIDATRMDARLPDDDTFLYGADPDDEEVNDEEVAELLRTQTVVADGVPRPDIPFALKAPRGWDNDRTAVVVNAAVGTSRPAQAAVDSFVRGDDLVVVERALRPGDIPTWSLEEGIVTDAPLGDGRLLYFADRVELRIRTNEAHARIWGPSVEIVRAFADGLRVRG